MYTHTQLNVHKHVDTRRQTSRLAIHTRHAGLDSKRDPKRLFATVRSQTVLVSQGSLHLCPRRSCSDPQRLVCSLLSKGAIETVPAAQSESGFYSLYFLVPKKDAGFRPILDLRVLNRALARWPFKMLTAKRIIALIRPGDWFILVDL